MPGGRIKMLYDRNLIGRLEVVSAGGFISSDKITIANDKAETSLYVRYLMERDVFGDWWCGIKVKRRCTAVAWF